MQRTKGMELIKTNTKMLKIDDQEYERVKNCKHLGTVYRR
jgi:hypothetical protein